MSGEGGLRWQVTWRWTRPDPLLWLTAVAGVVFIGFCVADGWSFAAALGGLFLGFLLTLHAFLTGHFVMESARRVSASPDTTGGRGDE